MSTYVIGDVQGCYDALMRLLDLIEFDEHKDKLWFVGDLVNRGPDSLKVLRFLKNAKNNSIIVLGNHDLHLLAVAKNYQSLRPLDTFQEVFAANDLDELIFWLRHLPLLHYDAELNFVMIHAGLYPKWSLDQAKILANEVEIILRGDQCDEFLKVMYGNQPDCWRDDLKDFDRTRFIINAFTRMRYCDQAGHLNLTEKGMLEDKPKGFFPWFDINRQDSIDVNIVFGHWAALNGKTNIPKVFATDTGCAWGYDLTALRLEDQKYFQVSCEKPL